MTTNVPVVDGKEYPLVPQQEKIEAVTIAIRDADIDKAQYFDSTDPAINQKKHQLKKGGSISAAFHLTWKELGYSVMIPTDKEPEHMGESVALLGTKLKRLFTCEKTPMKEKKLLQKVSGDLRPGEMMALMGASGAGKSTLLDVLAKRKNAGEITGEIKLNEQPLPKTYARIVSYVEQQDVLLETVTVRELLTFTALLRLPQHIPKEKKLRRVEEVIVDLGLEKCADTVIGGRLRRGISGGQAKRVNVGLELLTNPAVLFLDEPTSGLDSATAFELMSGLRELANNGRSVICTIHQPSTDIFRLFDRLLLLSAGEIIYFGPAHRAVDYFMALDPVVYTYDPQTNPADWLVSVCKDHGTGAGKTSAELIAAYESSALKQKNVADQQKFANAGSFNDIEHHEMASHIDRFATGWWYSCHILTKRGFRALSRDPDWVKTRFLRNVLMAFVMATVYWMLGNTQSDLYNMTALLFFIVAYMSMGAMVYLGAYIQDRSLFYRERASATYRTSVYFIAMTIVEIPLADLSVISFSLLTYWLTGMNKSASTFFTYLLFVYILEILAISLAHMVSILSPSFDVASSILPAALSILMLFGGFMIRRDSIPKYWIWVHYISFFKYAFEALTVNELKGRGYNCSSSEVVPVGPNQTICPITRGDQQLEILGFGSVNKWQNLGVLISMIAAMRIVSYIALRFLRHQTR